MLTLQSVKSKTLGFIKKYKTPLSMASVPVVASSAAFTASAEGGSASYETVVTAVSSQLSDANLVSVLAYAVGIAVVMVFTWWAVRKCTSIIKRAFMRGKLRL